MKTTNKIFKVLLYYDDKTFIKNEIKLIITDNTKRTFDRV